MSPAQNTLYFRLWNKAVLRQGWKPVKRRIQFDDARMTKEGRIIAAIAEELSIHAHRAVNLDDLRHGLHRLALGRVCSSKEINKTTEFDAVRGYLLLLGDETSIAAARAITDTEAAQRKRLVVAIRSTMDEPYILAIAHARTDWGLQGDFWEDLPMWALKQLLVTVKERARKHAHAE